MEAGMLAVVTKPINPPLLFATLAQVLGGNRGGGMLRVVPQPAISASPASAGSTVLWDAQALTRTMGNFPAIHKRLLVHFRTDSSSYLEQIALAVDQSRYADAAEVAHKFKSSARTVGAMRLGDLCEHLEKAGRNGDSHLCRTLSARLPQELVDVSEYIDPATT
jgi:HPt (histidine-containing phosphotransfer) domain-containing protein